MEKGEWIPSEASLDDFVARIDIEGGLYLNKFAVGKSVSIKTRQHNYIIKKISDREYLISGHPDICPNPIKISISGSTLGHSLICQNIIGFGMCIEFRIPDDSAVITTSPVLDIKEL